MEVINENEILAKQEANNKRKDIRLCKLLLFKVTPKPQNPKQMKIYL